MRKKRRKESGVCMWFRAPLNQRGFRLRTLNWLALTSFHCCFRAKRIAWAHVQATWTLWSSEKLKERKKRSIREGGGVCVVVVARKYPKRLRMFTARCLTEKRNVQKNIYVVWVVIEDQWQRKLVNHGVSMARAEGQKRSHQRLCSHDCFEWDTKMRFIMPVKSIHELNLHVPQKRN